MHSHELGVRWSDLDPNRHLNNVRYIAYAEEAQAAMVEAGELTAGRTVSTVTVTFRQPLLLTRRPVLVESTLVDAELVQDICVDASSGRVVFARVTSTFGEPVVARPSAERGGVSCQLRRSDLDASGTCTLTGLFDLVQEGRTRYAAEHRDLFPTDALAVGRMTMHLGEPLPWRQEPYEVSSWISKVTGALVMIESEVADGATVHVHASSVHLPFDIGTQQSRRLTQQERERLATLVVPSVVGEPI